ncbi:MAG: PEGA domain-containing protein [Gammaproteobacteria bacterium]|nr:MAG: PEGA domain-containing protein [Gammaproteobacteria bacterium]
MNECDDRRAFEFADTDHRPAACRRVGMLATLLTASLLAACATMTRSTEESFVIETEPPGARVKASTGWQCVTPCEVQLKRRSDFVLLIEKPGYEPVTQTIKSSIDGAGEAGLAGNVLLGGLVGAVVDSGSGAMHSHHPNPLRLVLTPAAAGDGQPSRGDSADAQQQEQP